MADNVNVKADWTPAERAYVKKGMDLLIRSVQRAEIADVPGSEIKALRGRELLLLKQLYSKL